ncbi:hypothetical protein CONLIGDRAFT_643021 [Coniochaeta ligniaria NRRL 30616]|uniref:Uncharacterized protein n=1 Tax=Coniochaeta ligniaria NRRL 30616 TaxID=1408157 RepID=A0A1J7IUX9_9PEZI|nr:hypothetical protein CONLIGDRAFT_643021 [Coniochaeta ligniaria NRRL 30616]
MTRDLSLVDPSDDPVRAWRYRRSKPPGCLHCGHSTCINRGSTEPMADWPTCQRRPRAIRAYTTRYPTPPRRTRTGPSGHPVRVLEDYLRAILNRDIARGTSPTPPASPAEPVATRHKSDPEAMLASTIIPSPATAAPPNPSARANPWSETREENHTNPNTNTQTPPPDHQHQQSPIATPRPPDPLSAPLTPRPRPCNPHLLDAKVRFALLVNDSNTTPEDMGLPSQTAVGRKDWVRNPASRFEDAGDYFYGLRAYRNPYGPDDSDGDSPPPAPTCGPMRRSGWEAPKFTGADLVRHPRGPGFEWWE